MRVVTFNIQHGAEGLDRIASLLKSFDADVCFLQEVDRGCRRSGGVDQAQVLAEALGMHPVFGEAMPFDGGSYGLAILSREPLGSPRVHPLPHHGPARPDGHGEPRIVLTAERGSDLVACTHLGLDAAERETQARALRTLFEPAQRPLLLGGDFNDGPDSPVAVALTDWLVDAFAEAGGEECQTAPPDRPGTRIDFVFRNRHAPRAQAARVGPEGYSDHRAVIVELES